MNDESWVRQQCSMCRDNVPSENIYFQLGLLLLCEKHFNKMIKFIAQNKTAIISMLK